MEQNITETKSTTKSVWDLKEELKQLASEIKQTKIEFKDAQRRRTGEFKTSRGGWNYWIDTTPRQEVEKEWKLHSKLHVLKSDFRHKHIAYCLLRGTSYEDIEKPSLENSPNWSIIEGVRNVYGS